MSRVLINVSSGEPVGFLDFFGCGAEVGAACACAKGWGSAVWALRLPHGRTAHDSAIAAQTSAARPPDGADDRAGAGFGAFDIKRCIAFRFAAFRFPSPMRRSSPICLDLYISVWKRRISWSQQGFPAPEIRYDARTS
jgi:hypothetical protein